MNINEAREGGWGGVAHEYALPVHDAIPGRSRESGSLGAEP